MPARTVKIFSRELSFSLNSEADQSVFEEVFVDRDYRPLDDHIVAAKNLIIDIGAHIGCFSVYCAAQNNIVPILAFEPEQNNFQALKSNLAQNKINTVRTKNQAVSDKIGESTIHLSPDSHNHSLLNLPAQTGSQKISTTTIEHILQKYDTCDLLKVDAEGSEFTILPSITPAAWRKIRNIYIEYHEFGPEQKKSVLENILRAQGFRVTSKPSHYDRRFGFIFGQK